MRMNSSRFTDAFGRNDHLQAVAGFFVDSTIVSNPGTLKGAFERVTSKHVAHEIQESGRSRDPIFEPSLRWVGMRVMTSIGCSLGAQMMRSLLGS
jgi:hypothetical protein